MRVWIETPFDDLQLGESVAINGVCLTVAEYDDRGNALFFISPETLKKTHLQNLTSGSSINLERAVSLETRLSGHLVQGHVDGMGRLLRVREVGEAADRCYELSLEIPEGLSRYCVEKGSIALNGVSLTINSMSGLVLSFMLIPHTWTHTQFKTLAAGDFVNIEVDVMAKYVERLCQPYLKHSLGQSGL